MGAIDVGVCVYRGWFGASRAPHKGGGWVCHKPVSDRGVEGMPAKNPSAHTKGFSRGPLDFVDRQTIAVRVRAHARCRDVRWRIQQGGESERRLGAEISAAADIENARVKARVEKQRARVRR
jgi:hypothetical protein